MTKEVGKTFNETLDWAKGHTLISIGKGDFESAMYAIVYTAWTRGYEESERHVKEGKK